MGESKINLAKMFSYRHSEVTEAGPVHNHQAKWSVCSFISRGRDMDVHWVQGRVRPIDITDMSVETNQYPVDIQTWLSSGK